MKILLFSPHGLPNIPKSNEAEIVDKGSNCLHELFEDIELEKPDMVLFHLTLKDALSVEMIKGFRAEYPELAAAIVYSAYENLLDCEGLKLSMLPITNFESDTYDGWELLFEGAQKALAA